MYIPLSDIYIYIYIYVIRDENLLLRDKIRLVSVYSNGGGQAHPGLRLFFLQNKVPVGIARG